MEQHKKLLSITATDSSAGAGLLADIKVAASLNVPCEAVVVAVTAQNQQGALAAQPLELGIIQQQYQAAMTDGEPAIIRLGWLPLQVEFLQWLVTTLEKSLAIILWDPVLGASHGSALNQNWRAPEYKPWLLRLLARVDLLTPNAQETIALAEHFSGVVSSPEQAAKKLAELGKAHVLVTGLLDKDKVRDYFIFNSHSSLGQDELPGASLATEFYLSQNALTVSRHGTGCHFIAQLACRLLQEQPLYDALVQANTATRLYLLGKAQSLTNIQSEHWPDIETTNNLPAAFASLTKPLGLYGLVDNLEHLRRLLSLGIDSLQWRVKNLKASYEKDTQTAIKLCQAAGVPLFINDDWSLAIKLGAYGVHLGQEDLSSADLTAIQQAGLRLGISTHSDWEIARAATLNPSYIAVGPIFKPLSKKLKYQPVGIRRLKEYLLRYPQHAFACIGGITEKNARQVCWATGVSSIAVVTALANDAALPERFMQLQRCLGIENI